MDEYYPHPHTVDKLQTWCKSCASDKNKKHREKYPDKERARQKAIHVKRKTDPELREKRRRDYLRLKFKMTLEEYNEKLNEQNGVCAICRQKCFKRLSVDHDHVCCPYGRNKKSCGKCVRGLLCSKCNHALGLFNDSRYILTQAIEYLDKYKN